MTELDSNFEDLYQEEESELGVPNDYFDCWIRAEHMRQQAGVKQTDSSREAFYKVAAYIFGDDRVSGIDRLAGVDPEEDDIFEWYRKVMDYFKTQY